MLHIQVKGIYSINDLGQMIETTLNSAPDINYEKRFILNSRHHLIQGENIKFFAFIQQNEANIIDFQWFSMAYLF